MAPEALPSLRPRLRAGTWPALVLQLQPAVLHGSTHKMFAPIVFADVIAYSNKAELWPHKTSCVTNDFFFYEC